MQLHTQQKQPPDCPPRLLHPTCPSAEGRVPIPDAPVRFNVKNFGAKGNGADDDSAALQAAVEAANESPTGGVVFFPPGVYMLYRPLTIFRSGVVLRGAGEGKTTIHMPQSLGEVFKGTWTSDGSGERQTNAAFTPKSALPIYRKSRKAWAHRLSPHQDPQLLHYCRAFCARL